MDPTVWDRVQEVYYSALPLVPSERPDFVERACNSDPLITREVTSLLEADESSAGFLESPIFERGLKIFTSDTPGRSQDASNSPADELIGRTIDGRYLVEKELSHGGMGTVYLARDVTLHNRPIVIKVLLHASLENPYVVKKFKQEVEALARIDHPGVVAVLGAGELEGGKPFIGMQFVNGVTLRSQIPSEGMSFDRAASILKQVGAALDDVHEKRIFHRDLKPENIMLQPLTGGAELVKLVDFGIAKVKDSVVAPSTVNQAPVGTVRYMSPEQLRGERITNLSDIYSMAIIAYEMVTGRRPFNPSSAPQLLEMHQAGARVRPIDLRSDLASEAQAIILRGLSFKPQDRYQSASEFGDSLARALSENNLRSTLQMSSNPGGPVRDSVANDSIFRRLKMVSRVKLAVGLLVAVAIAALISIYIFRPPALSQPTAGPNRSFNYWLMVQKTRVGRNYQDEFQSSGQEIFENGYKFRLNVSSPDPGYLYVINEGPPDKDGTTLTMVYPTPLRSDAFVSYQPVHTNWNTFRGQRGTENFWIVWSVGPLALFESVKGEAFDSEKGALTDPKSISAVKDFLMSHAEPKPETTKDSAAQLTHVRGVGDVLVKLAELEHR